ncbi:MAG: hypothetical protein K2H31_11930 [Lachnospiraceae bacterium]|nr:hypothetical protein [Lachnospiraceae bacterium]
MDNEHKKAKRFVIVLFLACLFIALACFGIFIYIFLTIRGTELVNDRIVTLSKAIVMIGIFFLVLAFGYLVPILLSSRKRDVNRNAANTSDILDETNMRKALEKYIPDGETLLAGIHAMSNETNITGVFGKWVCTESKLIPDENGGTVALNKKKYSTYSIYIGITQYSLIIAECERNRYLYQFDDNPNAKASDIQEVTSDIFLVDIGTCFPLADIQNCDIKNGWMGSVKCFITMNNGSYFKLMLPKLGGLGGGMPHHTEYREAIIARLSRGHA